MDYGELLNVVCAHINDIPNGQIFFVKDLFYGTGWNELEKGEKLGFGRYFKKAVLNGAVSGVQFIGKTDNNSVQYKRI